MTVGTTPSARPTQHFCDPTPPPFFPIIALAFPPSQLRVCLAWRTPLIAQAPSYYCIVHSHQALDVSPPTFRLSRHRPIFFQEMVRKGLPHHVFLRTFSQAMVNAWERTFDKARAWPEIHISQGDVFSPDFLELVARTTRAESIKGTAALTSPANSLGCMRGGMDRAITDYYGMDLETRVQEGIRTRDPSGVLPVGEALVVPLQANRDRTAAPDSASAALRWLVSAPTIAAPSLDVSATENAFLACSAALRAVQAHNTGAPPAQQITALILPAFGTGIGGLPRSSAAAQMYVSSSLHPWPRLYR